MSSVTNHELEEQSKGRIECVRCGDDFKPEPAEPELPEGYNNLCPACEHADDKDD